MPADPRSDALALARLRRLLVLLALAFVVAELLAAAGVVAEPLSAVWTPYGFGQFVAMALLGTFVLHLWCESAAPVARATLGLAVAAELVRVWLQWRGGWERGAIAVDTGLAAGLASFAAQGWFAARARGDERTQRLTVLSACALLAGFVVVSNAFVSLTAALHPLTLDALTYAFDGSLGFQPAFVMGRLFRALPHLARLSEIVYLATPFGFALLWAAERRAPTPPPIAILSAFLVASATGFALYHAFPVAGPVYVVGAGWPLAPPSIATMGLDPALAEPVARNCMPSLHTTWVLLLVWHSRGRALAVRAIAFAFFVFTILATLGDGVHYLVDLVVAVPFAAAVQAACAPAMPRKWRRFALLAAMVLAWLVLLRARLLVLHPHAVVSWTLTLATVAAGLWLERAIWRDAAAVVSRAAATPELSAPIPAPARADAASARNIAAVFFLSGAAGLLYEVVFDKALALTFGSTARAATIVLATYMGGIALGAWIGARVAARRRDPLRLYAACEGGVALLCALSPLSFALVRRAYVALAAGADPARPSLAALQLGLGALVLLPPTFLMGVTTPALVRYFTARRQTLGLSVGMLYGANTLGAALGALIAGYLLLPAVGVSGTTWVAVAANLGVALVALRMHGKGGVVTPEADREATAVPSRRDSALAIAVLAVGGVVTLALEIVYVHLLAVAAGNSAYAFALMLACFLVALGGGAAAMRFALRRGFDAPLGLALCELGVAICLLGGVFVWNRVPDYFASYAQYPLARSFGAREVVRLVVCALAMIPPAACIGAAYPAAMEWVGAGTTRPVVAMGRAAALNTAGNIVGALVGAWLVAAVGSLRALHLAALVATLLGLAAVAGVTSRRRLLALAPLVPLALLALAQPRSFDLGRLSSGANVYFAPQGYGEVIDHAESLDGGLTTVAQSHDDDGARVLTLLTNGKFQGDDSPKRELGAQLGFAAYPLLHTTARKDALVIGFGTGVTAAAMHGAGFRSLDVVDLSRDVLSLADRWFGRVNGGVLHAPAVRSHVTDGRNWLMLAGTRYDVITVEVTSIWFAGAASLYNREFYQLAAAHLAPHGVMQQWLQMHRLAPLDLASILASVRAVFPRVWVYFNGTQAAIVACADDCAPTPEAAAALDASGVLGPVGRSAAALAQDRMLDGDGVDRLLAGAAKQVGGSVEDLVSDDDNLFLEYHTPRANVRPYAATLRINVAWMRSFAAAAAGD